ncbi:DUF2470 domain-containing protein [Paramicrobacterium agarici]|uniref:Uncharacterized protein DUF2470 n=1 Tax=Paramicrobacterium agarici TaxID=630514 RepID=A0A2A9DWC4_9MICO|nr:DUF2470 domain-containing protein [Microbacterium agarici]PFG30240.1 uncharacterized protein DUF2470 [Microbacterium agarici]
MTQHFDNDVISAILAHMNGDHVADNHTIVHAFADPAASDVAMVGFDGDGGDWEYSDAAGATVRTRIPWPAEVVERKDVRRAVVELHRGAVQRLGGERGDRKST